MIGVRGQSLLVDTFGLGPTLRVRVRYDEGGCASMFRIKVRTQYLGNLDHDVKGGLVDGCTEDRVLGFAGAEPVVGVRDYGVG